MVRLSPESPLLRLEVPTFETEPYVKGPPLRERRVAMISTAGLHRRDDRPFGPGSNDYRVLFGESTSEDIVMSHVSVNYDRTGFAQDFNVVFPIDRLRELAEEGVIGSVASYHYSFMGATDPARMEETARSLASLLKDDHVDAAILIPV